MTTCRLSDCKTLFFAITLGLSSHSFAATVTGAGSTFIYPAMSQWTTQYKKDTGNKINYQSIGSGGGLQQLAQGTIDFAASDQPLTIEELKKHNYLQFPAISSGIVLAYHLPIKKTLVLDGKTTGAIFAGQIKFWDNPAIAELNPTITLPHLPIITVHRSDGSGTTYNFTYYLSQVAPSLWTSGVGKMISWPSTSLGGKGNAGVANYIKQISGTIGYVEYSYTKDSHITSANMVNAAGNAVAPNLKTFQASTANANWQASNGFNLILVNELGKNSWPLTASTFILIRKHEEPAITQSIKQFFKWVFNNPDASTKAANLDFITMPPALVKKIMQTIAIELPTDQIAVQH